MKNQRGSTTVQHKKEISALLIKKTPTIMKLHFFMPILLLSLALGTTHAYPLRAGSNYSAVKINFKLQLVLVIRTRKISLGAWWRLSSMRFC